MYFNVPFRSPVWMRNVADRFRQSLERVSIDYLFIVYSVASNRLVTHCFCILREWFIWHLSQLHHIDIWFCDFIVYCLRLEQIVTGLMVQNYCVLLLILTPLWLNFMHTLSTAVVGTLWKREQPENGSHMYLTRIKDQFEGRKKSWEMHCSQLHRIFGTSSVLACA